jgi:hypothetical protein
MEECHEKYNIMGRYRIKSCRSRKVNVKLILYTYLDLDGDITNQYILKIMILVHDTAI